MIIGGVEVTKEMMSNWLVTWPICPRAEWFIYGEDGAHHIGSAIGDNYSITAERGPTWDAMKCSKCGEVMDIYGANDRKKHAHIGDPKP